MPREIDLAGFLMPTLLPWLLVSMGLLWVLDTLMGRLGLYKYVWHPPLVRLAVFIILFGLPALSVYR